MRRRPPPLVAEHAVCEQAHRDRDSVHVYVVVRHARRAAEEGELVVAEDWEECSAGFGEVVAKADKVLRGRRARALMRYRIENAWRAARACATRALSARAVPFTLRVRACA